MRKNKNLNKKSIMFYLNKHRFAVFFYILAILLGCAAYGVNVILGANILASITVLNFSYTIRLLIIIGVVQVFRQLFWTFSYMHFAKYSNIIWVEIASDLTKRSFELSSSTFAENNTGSFIQRIANDPMNVLNKMASIVEIISETLTNLVVVIYILTLNWIIGIIYIILICGLLLLEFKRRKVSNKKLKFSKKVSDKTHSFITEVINSEKDIKVLGMENKLYDTCNKNLSEQKNANVDYEITDTSFWAARNILIDIVVTLVLLFSITLLRNSYLTITTFILLFTYRSSIYDLIWCIGMISESLAEVKISTERMLSMFDEKIYKTDTFGNVNIKNVKGKISFKNVKFSYSDVEEIEVKTKKGKTKKELKHNKKEPIFNNLSFSIKPNTTVAFVGKSGSGKSTIASLIAKLNDVDDGQVLIDNKDIKTLSKETIRNNISMINQFPYIFDMSIKENLLMVKKDATNDELWDVLKRACFDEDVKSMPKGIDTKVGETGVKLSGGQRQRLAIARALLKNSKIIIFDESTSSLDNFAQSHIQKSIENLKGQHTIIIIAHRLSTIKNVDKIYFIEKGEIKGEGSFYELFENNKDFQNMFMIENI